MAARENRRKEGVGQSVGSRSSKKAGNIHYTLKYFQKQEPKNVI